VANNSASSSLRPSRARISVTTKFSLRFPPVSKESGPDCVIMIRATSAKIFARDDVRRMGVNAAGNGATAFSTASAMTFCGMPMTASIPLMKFRRDSVGPNFLSSDDSASAMPMTDIDPAHNAISMSHPSNGTIAC
jgi:hypothetical protein